MPRVLLADDHRLFTDLVTVLLEREGVEVVGAAATPARAISRIHTEAPTVCLVDPVTLAPRDPLGLVTHLARAGTARVLVLTADPTDPPPVALAAAGAAGGLGKSVSGEALVAALRRVAAGASVWPVDDGEEDALEVLGRLRARERECLGLLAAGASTAEMAATMGVSPATVRSHVRAVLAALGVHTRLAAAAFALRHGITSSDASGRAATG